MNFLLDPLQLSFSYLVLLFTGTNFETLLEQFITGDKLGRFFQYFPNQDTRADTFDFIIVGGGSAGCVLANRLSASNYRVLLLEAGGNPFPLTSIPAMALRMFNHPEIDWNFKTVPQTKSFQANVNKAGLLTRGKGLGGSSLLNFMVYLRGNPINYDTWADITGDPSWSYQNVMPIFKRLEDYDGYFPNNIMHGRGGPLRIEASNYLPLLPEWIQAGRELGLKVNDPNGYQNSSVFPCDTTTKSGTRFSTHRAYLHPVLGRPNLDVLTYAHVQKVHLDENNKAVGVTYERNGQQLYVKANKEIIISAGAICSPQILMLSGIGPKEHLESLGIPLKVDLPVGQNFQDHFLSFAGPFLLNQGKSLMGDREYNFESLQKYLRSGEGPYSTLGAGASALLESSVATPGWPDIFLSYQPNGITEATPANLQAAQGLEPGVMQKYLAKDIGKDAYMVAVTLGRPKSIGEIKLNSTNPFDPPLIDPKYLSHPDDVKAVVEGVQHAIKFSKTPAFQKIGGKLTDSLLPGCENFADNTSDEYWECYVKQFSGTMYHYCGTCRMGASSGDPGAVVDSQLKVLGTTGLRVIDASVMPHVTTTNTNGPTIMIAEKGSDMILKFWAGR